MSAWGKVRGGAEWGPSASLETLKLRAHLLRVTRQFFDERGYWEVDTPLLSRDRVVDPHLAPFVAFGAEQLPQGPSPGGAGLPPRESWRYLQTSPEFCMKRLLTAGAEAIYQLGKVFRQGEVGVRHNPEFTMLEWYRVGDDHHRQMDLTEDYVVTLARAATDGRSLPRSAELATPRAGLSLPFKRTTYREAFHRYLHVDVFRLSDDALPELARSRGVVIPESLEPSDRDGWLNLLLAEVIEPQLGADVPEFLIDYPPTQAALAVIRPAEDSAAVPVAERFELYVNGIEMCNGYHELTDPAELRRRMGVESARRGAAGLPPLPEDSRLLQAMERGLPSSAGVALGFDRLLMWIAGKSRVGEVLPFAWDRA